MNPTHPILPRKKSVFEQTKQQRIVVGVAGGSAAGKTTLCQNINRQMAFDRNFKVQIISLDSFYKNVDKEAVDITQYNFDHPNALDFDLAYKTLQNLIESNDPVPVPQYSFIQHARLKQPQYVGPANIIFFQGLMAFYDKRIRDLLTYKIFINCDDDIRLCRRLKRDTVQRGRSVISVLEQYNKFVKNAFRDFILPSIVYADIIIPGFRNNRVSVDFIVQHIKNMARRITFKERAVKNKAFIFGQAQIYDLQAANSYDIKVTTEQQSFLVFPTSSEHRKQLQFFLTSLLSQIFSVEYFHEVYIHQFIKILKALLNQLMILKNFKSSQMQIFSVYNIQEVLAKKCDKYPIKIIFFPVAQIAFARQILEQVKQYIANNSSTTFVILNAFCDMNVPQMIYRLKMSNVIMINLFVIANDRRFRQIMANNIEVTSQNFDWFVHNHFIATQGASLIAKEFKLYQLPTQELILLRYDTKIQQQRKQDLLRQKHIDQSKEIVNIVNNIKQFNVYAQEHANLCGYHALNTILCLQNKKDIKDKQIFIENYNRLSTQVNNKVDYSVLERYQVPLALNSEAFSNIKNIGVLFFSFKYLQNTQEQNDQLQKLFNDLLDGKKPYIYVILGVHSHYVLVKVTKTQIEYYDSMHNSLRDVWNGTEEGFHPQQKNHPDFKNTKHHLANLKEALQILLDLKNKKTNVNRVMYEKITEDIVGSFNAIKDNNAQVDHWIKNQYPRAVLESQLLKPLKEKKVQMDQIHSKMLKEWLSHPKIKQLLKDSPQTVTI